MNFASPFLRALLPFFLLVTAAAQAQPAPLPGKFTLANDRWTYKDGDFEMSGILLKPEGKGPYPGVLISHGKGGSAESFGLQKARLMTGWGMVCIAPNYTHSANATLPKDGRDAPGLGASAVNIRRAETCLQILRSLPQVDGRRLAAYGHSMGGFVTIGLAAERPALLQAAAITGSGIAPRDGYPAPSEKEAIKIRTPFLMLHGMNDTTVRPEQSEALKKILDEHQVPNDRLVADGQGHPIDQTMTADVFRLVREWFSKHGVLKEK